MSDKDTNVPNKMEYISREAAIKILHDRAIETAFNNFGVVVDASVVLENVCRRSKVWLEDVPAADVVEVVRCKDCINWNGNDCITMYGLCRPLPNDFCARGHKLEVTDNGQTT